MRKNCLVIIILLLSSLASAAQNILTIIDMPYCDKADMDAVHYKRTDNNNVPCALLKLSVQGSLPKGKKLIMDTVNSQLTIINSEKRENGDWWFWIQEGTKSLKLTAEGFNDLRFDIQRYDENARDGARQSKVYVMKIDVQEEGGPHITNTFLKAHILPVDADAQIFLGSSSATMDMMFNNNGEGYFATDELNFGTYYYKVVSQYYEEETGRIGLTESNNNIEITLKPKYSYIDINAEPSNAKVLIDNKPVTSNTRYLRGEHTVTASLAGYSTYTRTIDIPGDGNRFTVDVTLSSNQGTIQCMCEDKEADIYVDNKFIGRTGKRVTLKGGIKHTVEARREGFESRSVVIDLKVGDDRIVQVEAPIELFGYLSVQTTPSATSVYIGKTSIGVTPLKQKLRIGKYTVSLNKDGYLTKDIQVEIPRDQTTSIKETLEKGRLKARVTLKTQNDAYIKVNGITKGMGSWTEVLEEGDYVFSSYKKDCNDAEISVNIRGSESRTIEIPAPSRKIGSVYLSGNTSGAHYTITDNDGNKKKEGLLPATVTLPTGSYHVKATKNHFEDSPEYLFSVSENRRAEVSLHMKRIVWISTRETFPHVFGELNYGYNPTASYNPSYFGFTLGIVKSHIGGNLSVSTNLNGSFTGTIGPTLRLTNDYGGTDFQLYAGGGLITGDNTNWLAEAGCRLAFENDYSDGFQWISLTAGAKFNSDLVIPTVGISLMPVAFARWLADEEESFPAHFIYTLGGYDTNGAWHIGLGYQYLESHIGFYGNFMSSLKQWQPAITVGPAIRLTSDSSVCDLQIYGGLGYSRGFAQEVGMRFGWDTDTSVSLWDFSIGALHDPTGWMPVFSIGTGISLAALCVGGTIALTAWAIKEGSKTTSSNSYYYGF